MVKFLLERSGQETRPSPIFLIQVKAFTSKIRMHIIIFVCLLQAVLNTGKIKYFFYWVLNRCAENSLLSSQIASLMKLVSVDGLWVDMNEISNFCNGECTSSDVDNTRQKSFNK